MQFAIVDDRRTLSSPGLRGACPGCGGVVIPKCGSERVHHWAHRGAMPCDYWREPEKPWHRTWKECFPPEWREVIRFAASGRKHIADVHTPHGLTIEFQYSHLPPAERTAREECHTNMAWVVSGSRRQSDLPRFMEGSQQFRRIPGTEVYLTAHPETAFPRGWLNCGSLVFFDFVRTSESMAARNAADCTLWCLLPGRIRRQAVVLRVSGASFIQSARGNSHVIATKMVLDYVGQWLALEARQRLAQLRALLARSRGRHMRHYARF